MPAYHFTPEPFTPSQEKLLPDSRITTEYSRTQYETFGLFHKAEYFQGNTLVFILGNCEGSLMLIDTARDISKNPINKLHIGQMQLRRPHAESFEEKGEKGVRVDLAQFDTHYAKALLSDLRKWRDPKNREELLTEYSTCKQWYGIPYRIKQLKISSEGLEKRITELEDHIRWLRTPPQGETRRFVYESTRVLEDLSYKTIILMNYERDAMERARETMQKEGKLTNHHKKMPKVIFNPDISKGIADIAEKTREVFDFICPKIDVQRARGYWQEVANWENQ